MLRFIHSEEMKWVFPRPNERRDRAAKEFQRRWNEALATVTHLNGNRYFID